jgi:hypothetical protein
LIGEGAAPVSALADISPNSCWGSPQARWYAENLGFEIVGVNTRNGRGSTAGLSTSIKAKLMVDFVKEIKDALERSHQISFLVWDKMPDAKFSYRVKNIFETEQWSRSTERRAPGSDMAWDEAAIAYG